MLKNIYVTLLSLGILAASPLALAADDPAAEQAVPATVMPAEPMPVEPVPASAPVKEAVTQTSTNTRPINDNHTDYRYCLELKTNIEIIQCRYKK